MNRFGNEKMWKRGCFNALGWQKWALTTCHYPLMINVAVCPKCILVHSNIWGVFSCTPNKSPWMSQNDRVLFASFVFQRRTHPATKAARNALQNSRILKSSQKRMKDDGESGCFYRSNMSRIPGTCEIVLELSSITSNIIECLNMLLCFEPDFRW